MGTVTAQKLFRRLVENALDFLSRSIEELKDHPKYSVIHFHAAVELFLKARLMTEHWSLVVTKKKEPDWDKFVRGDFHSVSLDEAAVKLEKIVQSGLSPKQLEAFREIAKHRNKMIHFFHDAHSKKQGQQRLQAIARQQLNAWFLLHQLLANQWARVFKRWSKQIRELDTELRKHKEFLRVVFDNLREEIEKGKEAGILYQCCPSCGFESQESKEELATVYDLLWLQFL